MKKQINSVSICSLKSIRYVATLCAMLSAIGAGARNIPSMDSHGVSKEIKAEIKSENCLNRNIYPYDQMNSGESVNEEVKMQICEWMNGRSYWNTDEPALNVQPSNETGKVTNRDQLSEKKIMNDLPFIFNAENYIPESEF
jgi:hypothetical protein